MQWSDEGLIISTRRHGESGVIVDLLTRQHGRHAGLVRGGRGKRYRPILQLGNKVGAEWRGRLSEHLGMFILEPAQLRAALIMDEASKLLALQSVCILAGLVAEREPQRGLYEATDLLIRSLAEGGGARDEEWKMMLVQWELGLLAELGFGLDLACCAATGEVIDLIYVSPKSGRAVCAKAGSPYHDKLLALPSYLLPNAAFKNEVQIVREGDLISGLKLTGFFLEKYLFEPKGAPLPTVRQMLTSHFL